MIAPEIFYVEDNPADILLLESALKITGFAPRIATAVDGVQAIEMIGTREKKGQPFPDLVLLDLNLPKKNGYEVLRELKQNPKFESLRVLIFTGSGNAGDREYCLSLNAFDYWTKPGDLSQALQIAERLKSLLDSFARMEKSWR